MPTKPDNLYAKSNGRRQFAQGYQEALRDIVSAAITNADVSPVESMLEWIKNNADNDTTREYATRVAVWADVDAR